MLKQDSPSDRGVVGIDCALGPMEDETRGKINVDSTANYSMTSRSVAGRSHDGPRNRRQIVITTYAVTRIQMILFEGHFLVRRQTCSTDRVLSGFGYFTGSTQQVVTHTVSYIVAVRKPGTISNSLEVVDGLATIFTLVSSQIVHVR